MGRSSATGGSPCRSGYIALTFDHRVVDGARAAEFGLAVIRRLEGRRRLKQEPAIRPGSWMTRSDAQAVASGGRPRRPRSAHRGVG